MPDVRPIDANALKEDLKNMLARVMYESDLDFDHSHAKIWTATITGIQHSIKRLDNAPTIDAVPVVHGRWVRAAGKSNIWYCSVCGDKINYKQNRRTYNIPKVPVEQKNKFCRNCGAKMDGGA